MSKIISQLELRPGQVEFDLGNILNGLQMHKDDVIRIYTIGSTVFAELEDRRKFGEFTAYYNGRSFKVRMTNREEGIHIEVGEHRRVSEVISYGFLASSSIHNLLALKVESLCAALDKI